MASTAKQHEEQTALPGHLAGHEEEFCVSFQRDFPFLWLLTLVGPPLLTVVLLVVIGVSAGWLFVRKLVLTGFFTFFLFGKFVILSGDGSEVASPFFTPDQLFLLVLYMDLMTAMMLVFHAGFLFRIPYLGHRLLLVAEDGQFILQLHPWMRRATFVGITLFVMFPLAATGAVGAAIFGRLLGMSRIATFFGICLGSLLGCGAMYYGSFLINQYLDRNNLLLTVGGIAVIVAVIFLLNYRYRQLKKRARR
ncbi:MAG: small multi-drug export protein [Pirellulales bacterium]|nr:small multi-drug export protein [Pirellulales bacterium]